MIKYRITLKVDVGFGCYRQDTTIIESEKPISIKEISCRLNVSSDNIQNIDII